jgi:hypothetical protein
MLVIEGDASDADDAPLRRAAPALTLVRGERDVDQFAERPPERVSDPGERVEARAALAADHPEKLREVDARRLGQFFDAQPAHDPAGLDHAPDAPPDLPLFDHPISRHSNRMINPVRGGLQVRPSRIVNPL